MQDPGFNTVGFLKPEEFIQKSKEFLLLSTAVCDNWCMCQDGDVCYLTKKVSMSIPSSNLTSSVVAIELSETPESLDDMTEDLTETTDVPAHGDDAECCTFHYHIVYSHSYMVPVLYFNAYKTDGSLVSLDQLWSSVPLQYRDQLENKWAFLTQQEHPVLRQPFYTLHPCHTETLMKKVNSMNSNHSNYLVSWLSSVGPVVHLKLSLAYAMTKQEDT